MPAVGVIDSVVFMYSTLPRCKYRGVVMFMPLLLGCVTVIVSMSIQIFAVVFILQYLFKIVSIARKDAGAKHRTTYVISVIMVVLFIGHMIQVAVWAALFMFVGEFDDLLTAYYHSMVNFASLGYGDIVMSEQWRLMGAIESCIGVLMFGVSAGAMLSIMNFILSHDHRLKDLYVEIHKHPHKLDHE